LDLIKSGGFQLKKVTVDNNPKPLPAKKVESSGELTVQDLLQQAAAIREAVACSDSSEGGEESETTSW
jgi:sulfur carrier protein ThiS